LGIKERIVTQELKELEELRGSQKGFKAYTYIGYMLPDIPNV